MLVLDMILKALILIGALNWGSIGLFEFNFVEGLLGGHAIIIRAVYILVGVAALLMLVLPRL